MPSHNPPNSFPITLQTTLNLLDQFRASLSAPPLHSEIFSTPNTQSPIPLLTASVTSLKQTTTRVSLLTITPPFTPSALNPLLNNLNTSILPSLVTAIHLTTPAVYTTAFSAEAVTLATQTLIEFKSLLSLVSARSGIPTPTNAKEKEAVTECTGRVWSHCDSLLSFAAGGLAGFMTERVGQWLELMKDAVKELEEWDPADEFDPDDPLDGLISDDEEVSKDNEEEDAVRARMQTGVKIEALKVLTRIPQTVHVVVKQRLSKLPDVADLSTAQKCTLDTVVEGAKQVSENIDESVEAMYMGDLERCLKMAGEARAGAIRVVEAVVEPWGEEGKEDLYIKRALEWIRQVEPKPGEKEKVVSSVKVGHMNGIERGIVSMKIE